MYTLENCFNDEIKSVCVDLFTSVYEDERTPVPTPSPSPSSLDEPIGQSERDSVADDDHGNKSDDEGKSNQEQVYRKENTNEEIEIQIHDEGGNLVQVSFLYYFAQIYSYSAKLRKTRLQTL